MTKNIITNIKKNYVLFAIAGPLTTCKHSSAPAYNIQPTDWR